jgi:hypothetical protein
MTKHIKKYSQFIFEADEAMGVDSMAAGTAPAKPATRYKFIFISDKSDEGIARKKYPDGSVVVTYTCYSLNDAELEKWIKENVIKSDKDKSAKNEIEVRQENLSSLVKGDKTTTATEDVIYLEKLRRSLGAKLVGRVEPVVDVVYTRDGQPTTTDIDVTFINSKEK